jgi:hypothetical protein
LSIWLSLGAVGQVIAMVLVALVALVVLGWQLVSV